MKMLSWKNCTVLDPFMGAGTTGVVCKKLNRNFIGIELSEEYWKIAQKRIDKVGGDIFEENKN
jgi:DNA modification methylase